jgi:phenylalanyl-tRNA synthetase alpha chain
MGRKVTSYSIEKGVHFKPTIPKEETEITSEMLVSGAWKTATFKKYNFNAAGLEPPSGHLHPLLKVKEEFRQIFFEMG